MFKITPGSKVHARFHGIPVIDGCVPAGKLFVNTHGGGSREISLRKAELASGVEITADLGARGNVVAQIELSKEPDATWKFVLELQARSNDGKSSSLKAEAGSAQSSLQGVSMDYEVSK